MNPQKSFFEMAEARAVLFLKPVDICSVIQKSCDSASSNQVYISFYSFTSRTRNDTVGICKEKFIAVVAFLCFES